MAFNEEKAINDLMILYQKSFAKITTRIISDVKSGKIKTTDIALLESVNAEIKKLLAINNNWVNQVVPKIYNEARQGIIDTFVNAGLDALENPAFRTVHSGAIQVLQQNLYDNLSKGTIQVGRKIRDELRTGILDISAIQTSGALTPTEATAEVLQNFAEQGIFDVTYANGAKVSIDSYVDMAVKTTVDSSINRATINQSEEFDNDLVKMSYHSSSCPICALYEGRVYSISGNDERYPALNDINDGNMETYGTVHPNCRHRMLPYIEELDENAEEARKVSNQPFEDNRSEQSKKTYENRQKINGYENRKKTKEQENKILKAIPDKTPEQEAQIRRNNESIKGYKNKIKDVKDWEIDTTRSTKLVRKDVKSD